MQIKHLPPRASRRAPGFTMVEMLVVIAIIGILAAMILPALVRVKTQAKMKVAAIEMSQFANAIASYESANNQYPVSTAVKNAAAAANEDFTYGGVFKGPTGGPVTVMTPGLSIATPTLNAEVVCILLDIDCPANPGHAKNPQHSNYGFSPNGVSDTSSPGVGADFVYRDLWGNPYVTTLDLNSDGKSRDAFYRNRVVAQNSGQTGYYGLFNADPGGGTDHFDSSRAVMIWSAGPDGKIDPAAAARVGVNRDNILSWSPK